MTVQTPNPSVPETDRQHEMFHDGTLPGPRCWRFHRNIATPLMGQSGAALLIFLVALLGASSFLAIRVLTNMQGREAQRRTSTQALLGEARDALIGFAVTNGRLPCPALANIPSGGANAGQAPPPTGGTCPSPAGVLPWASLGVSETDAWGNRFTYKVSAQFSRSSPRSSLADFTGASCPPPAIPLQAAFALCSEGDMTIRATAGGAVVVANVAAAVISHGKNGFGAYTTRGNQLALGFDADEQTNQLTAGGTATAGTDFIAKALVSPALATPAASYDDHLIWLGSAPTDPLDLRMTRVSRFN